MRFKDTLLTSIGSKALVLEHNGEQLEFSTSGFLNPNRLDRVIRDINDYWSRIPAQRVQLIFDIYKDIHRKLEDIDDINRLNRSLIPDLEELLKQHPEHECLLWIEKHSNVKITREIKEFYDSGFPKEITYIRSEYKDLLALVLRSRVLLPIWSVYVAKVKEEYGVAFKEYLAASLLESTDYIDSVGYERLYVYIRHHVSAAQRSMASVLANLGSVEVPDYVIAMAVVRKLTTCELPNENEPDEAVNLVATLYNFITSTVEGLDNKFDGAVRNKLPAEGSDDSNPDNTSLAEGYKARASISEGDVELFSVYLDKRQRAATKIDSTIPKDLIEECWSTLIQSSTYQPQPCQFTLVQWVISKSGLSPQAIPHLDYDALMNAIAITQATLVHWGFPDLALLVTALAKETPSDVIYGTRSLPPTAEQLAQLQVLFPYHQQLKGKTLQRHAQLQGTGKQQVQQNPALLAIDKLASMTAENAWHFTAADWLIQQSTFGHSAFGRVPPAELKLQLADLVIRLNQ